MASTTTDIPRAPLFSRIRISAGIRLFAHRCMLAREISALRLVSQRISNPEIFDARIAEISAELVALRKS
ncbi:hypothetical protein LCGC14_0270690 [marine sediment metagenome]|uniref:Uncharacterized protein n=1 Tax=marine sediment metagenome TaxID=412755 RepID=A0A0F9TYX6_9ZZZZ